MMTSFDQEQSLSAIKNKRDQFVVEIRRKKNEDFLNAKRFKLTENKENTNPPKANQPSNDFENLSKAFINDLSEKNFEALGTVLENIRRLISSTLDPPLKSLIATNICPFISDFLDSRYKNFEKIQHEAAWILTNLASGTSDEAAYVVKLNCIPRFIHLVTHENDEISEQALWGIANISGDCQEYRDLCIDNGVVDVILDKINGRNLSINYIRNLTWAISNLCRGKPYPNYNSVSPFLPLLQKLIEVKDEEILVSVLWSLSYLTDGENERIEGVTTLGITDYIVQCLGSKNIQVITPALRTIGNLITGNDDQTEIVLQARVLDYLCNLLTHTKKIFRKESCWTISNILAGNPNQIQYVLDNEIVIKKLIQLIYNDEFDVKLEVLFCFSNATHGATMEQIEKMVEYEFIEVICDALCTTEQSKIILVGLDTLHNLLKMGNNYVIQGTHQINPYAQKLEACGGIKLIERLQQHPDPDVYNKVSSLIDAFFQIEQSD